MVGGSKPGKEISNCIGKQAEKLMRSKPASALVHQWSPVLTPGSGPDFPQ